MTDLIDKANESAEFSNDLALRQHRLEQAGSAQTASAEWCADCGIEIPEARRLAVRGVELCVDCQREEELRERLHR